MTGQQLPDGQDLSEPSAFWAKLGAEHGSEFAAHGFDDIKRRQALRYFTWRWRLRSVRESEQMRFLLRHSSMADWIRAAAEPIPLAADAWSPTAWPVSDRWLYSFAVRLLWDFAATRGDLDVLQLGEPILGNPLPVRHRGRLISQDLANTALEVKAIRRLLERGPPTSILEIGAGYGRTAHALLSLFPEARYTIIDIEPAISISRWYLTRLFPGAHLQFLDPRDVAIVPDESVDLALSISSLQEMTPGQVKGYLDLMDRTASGGSVYLKQWTEWRNPDDDLVMRFDAFPIPRRWSRRFIEPSPVQRRFTQAGWRIEDTDAGESPFEPA